MAILNNNPLIGSGGNQGYNINNSLRFRGSASAYLNRTPASAGNRRTWTWSAWIKLGKPSDFYALFGSTNNCFIGYGQSTGGANLGISDGNTSTMNVQTTALFRDPSAWYHFVVALDTTQATAANRVKIYVNGNQQTAFVASTYPSQNAEFNINNTTAQNIGRTWDGFQYFDGYMADINFIDGSQKAASDFGETDTTTGVWKPKAYSGTYGTNGFYLKFSDIATTSGSNAGLGKDFSGNSNYWTTNNISVTSGTTYDAMTDSPTNTSATVANYAVMNPIQQPTTGTWADGNLKYTTSGFLPPYATILPTSGKWYFEVTWLSGSYSAIGVQNATNTQPSTNFGDDNNGWRWQGDGTVYRNGVIATYSTYAVNDVIGIALDLDNGKLFFAKNNTWQNSADPAAGTNGITTIPTNTPFTVTATTGSGASAFAFNFGQRPFSYSPPSGYVALNTFNLPTPTILAGNKYMDATLYTGTSANQTIVNAGQFKPDFLWIKTRSGASTYNHHLVDSVRGNTYLLRSNSTGAEQGPTTDQITSFNSNGFSVGADTAGPADNEVNQSPNPIVAWQWQAGAGSTSTNTSGTISSTVSVNTTAGFSVVTWTATGSNATIGHGLGVAPKMIITKGRNAVNGWNVYTSTTGNGNYLRLDTTAASTSGSTYWNNTSPTSTVFSTGTWYSNTETYVAYCWAEIAGFSKFGSYTGNGSTDGTFVYTGFRPKYVLIKRTDTANDWYAKDTSRDPVNAAGNTILVDLSDAEYGPANTLIDILSNGFKSRTTSAGVNASSGTYIYMAFAEHPTKFALAR